MSDPAADLLRDAFQRLEHLAPDPAQVRQNVRRLARSHARRRVAAAVGGSTVVGGLIASAAFAPGVLLPRTEGSAVQVAGPAAAAATPARGVLPAEAGSMPVRQGSLTAEPGSLPVGAEPLPTATGRITQPGEIVAGQGSMPADPAGQELGPAPADPPDRWDVPTEDELDELAEFSDQGYTAADAYGLSQLWKLDAVYPAKVEGGRRLLAGQTLPIAPGSFPEQARGHAEEAAQVLAFFDAGYTQADAVALAKLWKMADADLYAAKVEAGRRLLAGEPLPLDR